MSFELNQKLVPTKKSAEADFMSSASVARGISIIVPYFCSQIDSPFKHFGSSFVATVFCATNSYTIPVKGTIISGIAVILCFIQLPFTIALKFAFSNFRI